MPLGRFGSLWRMFDRPQEQNALPGYGKVQGRRVVGRIRHCGDDMRMKEVGFFIRIDVN
jgi:hypothetical protein